MLCLIVRSHGPAILGDGMTFEKILVVDDEVTIRKMVEHHLRRQRYSVAVAATLSEAAAVLHTERFDLMFLDLCLPDGDGLELLQRVMQAPAAPVVAILSGCTGVEEAVRCIRSGAFDYILKPFSLEELDVVIRRAESHRHGVQMNRYMERELRCGGEIPGDSAQIRYLREMVQKVAPTEASVLLIGESGVGKQWVAEALHNASPRAGGPLIRVNCAAALDEQIESELFGHEEEPGREGRLELANGGTIVLEEISDLPIRTQVRLLRALQEREFERSTCGKPVQVDVRVVATTQRDLAECVARGSFRQDLLFRLNVFPLRVPPLRERLSDLPLLAERWLSKFAQHNGFKLGGISGEALRHLMSYSWPGNVRELENVLERAVILTGSGGQIDAGAFDFLRPASPAQSQNPISDPGAKSGIPRENEPLLTLGELEKRHVLRALEYTNQNRTRAAGLLKISVRTLRNKLHQYRAEASTDSGCRQSNLPMASLVAGQNRNTDGGMATNGIRLPQ